MSHIIAIAGSPAEANGYLQTQKANHVLKRKLSHCYRLCLCQCDNMP